MEYLKLVAVMFLSILPFMWGIAYMRKKQDEKVEKMNEIQKQKHIKDEQLFIYITLGILFLILFLIDPPVWLKQ